MKYIFYKENRFENVICKIVAILFKPESVNSLRHICIGNLTIIGSDNGLSPGLRQAIIWTNSWILWIGPLGTNFSEILIEIQTFSLKKMHFKVSSSKWWPFCSNLRVLIYYICWLLGEHWGINCNWGDSLFCRRTGEASREIPMWHVCLCLSLKLWLVTKLVINFDHIIVI